MYMNAKNIFIELSENRKPMSKDFCTSNYVKKRHLSKKDSILRKTCNRLLNAPQLS